MDKFNLYGTPNRQWGFPNSTVIDYHHQPPPSRGAAMPDASAGESNDAFNKQLYAQLQMLSGNMTQDQMAAVSEKLQLDPSYAMWKPGMCAQETTPFPESYKDPDEDDMEISDDERSFENTTWKTPTTGGKTSDIVLPVPTRQNIEVTSGAAFYKGLILFIPPLEQLSNTYKGSPAVKMLYASFEFSFKIPVKITTTPKEDTPNVLDATVFFQNHVLATGSGWAPHVEASVRALELLSETCYTIQAKEDYYQRCKLIDAENMKTLNLKKWEALSQKYPKLVDITKTSHIQKTFSVFLDTHTSTGVYEDMVCYNLTSKDVNNIKSVVEFFHLTMLPCALSTNLTKKDTPCVVSIQKYTSAQALLEILVECGGENDNFKLHPPDTFRDFYKLHQNYWDPSQRKPFNKGSDEAMTTLEDEDLQSIIMKPYENTISELFEKHKTLPKKNKSSEASSLRKAGDDFMKETLKIDMSQNKTKAPVERMQLLLKYMEQLQEYGSRVLDSGRQEMIKIYHNAIENLRKDLDECRKDIEKEQNDKDGKLTVTARRPSPRKRSPVRRRNRSRSRSPRQTQRSKSPRRRRSPRKSPLRRDRSPRSPRKSPLRRNRSPRSPRKSPLRRDRSPRSPRKSPPRRDRSPRSLRKSPPRRDRSPRSPPRRDRSPRSPLRGDRSPRSPRKSPPRRDRSPRNNSVPRDPSRALEGQIVVTIFKDQLKRFIDILRRFRIEIEDTPMDRRPCLRNKLAKCVEQLSNFYSQARQNMTELGGYIDELYILKEEINIQERMIFGTAWINLTEPQFEPPLPYGPPIHSMLDYGGAMSTLYPYQR